MSPVRTRSATSFQPNIQTAAISPCVTQVYVDSAARSYPATWPPASRATAVRIDSLTTPKTVFVNAPA
jgi:hypothetical protein